MQHSQPSKRKPYVRTLEKDWWLKNSFYTAYMIREGTCLLVTMYAMTLMCGLLRLVQGEAAFNGWLDSLSGPLGIIFHMGVLASCLFHAKTWFELAPKAIRLFKAGELIPAKAIITGQYIAAGVVAVVAWLIIIAG